MTIQIKDYPARLRELQRFSQEQYGISPRDSAAVAALTLRTAYPGEWVIVESSDHHFWEHLREAMWDWGMKFAFLGTRSQHSNKANFYIENVLKERRETHFWLDVYADNIWKRNSPFPHSRHGELEAECVRLRVPAPARVAPPDARGLRERLNRVWDFEHRKSFIQAVDSGNQTFIAYVRALQCLNPMLVNQRALIDNLSTLPGRHAALYGREVVVDEDQLFCLRVMRESVRSWTVDLLEPLLTKDKADLGDFLASVSLANGKTVEQLLEEMIESGSIADVSRKPGPRDKGHREPRWGWSADWGPDCRALLTGEARWW